MVIIWLMMANNNLVGGAITILKNISSSMGRIISYIMEIKHVPTTNQYIFCFPILSHQIFKYIKYAHLVGDPICTKASEHSTRKQHQWQWKANAKPLI